MSIHADDEFSLKIALEWELDDVLASQDLAGRVIARHRRTRRRRVAGAVSLVVVCAGIGVPLGLAVVEPPFGRVELIETLWWHPDRAGTAEHAWLRRTLTEVAAGLPPVAPVAADT